MNSQVTALLRKELRISRRNKRGTACEMIIPLIIGCACSFLIYVNDDVLSKITADPLAGKPLPGQWDAWIGLVEPLTPPLTDFYNAAKLQSSNSTVGLFSTTQDALDAYSDMERATGGLSFVSTLIAGMNGSSLSLMLPPGPQKNVTHTAALIWSLTNASATTFFFSAKTSSLNYHLLICMTAAMFIILAYMPNTIITAGRMVEEKINKVKELLKVMGLADTSYFLSHFIAAVLRMLPGVFFMSLTTSAFGAIKWDLLPTFFFCSLLFSISTTAYAFLMPVFFSKAVWSNVACVFFLYVLVFTATMVTASPSSVQHFACLASPISFFYVMMHIFAGPAFSSPVTLEFATGMIALDAVLYFALGAYLIQLFPGEFGIPKHPLFFLGLCSETYQGTKQNKNSAGVNPDTDDRIVFDSLVKRYGDSEVAAVNKLTMRVRKGEIFALLGHNGAGKTSTMNILTGLVTPTEYETASIDGRDIGSDMDAIRQNLGVCPQFDVLFNDLTAREHLELFAELRGLDVAATKERVARLLAGLELPDDGVTTAGKFSGGTKRRLSVGNALSGKNSLIILDEPSSGLDPLSRRKLWQIVKAEKEDGHTVLLSTHFMEEADYLGDRIGIMSKGRMYCCGTCQELKQQFACGFFLRLVKADGECNARAALELIQSVVPEAAMESQSSGDVTFTLPAHRVNKFEELLLALDARKAALGIHGYGLSMNSLEDVFVAISTMDGDQPDMSEGKLQSPQHIGGMNVTVSKEKWDAADEGLRLVLPAEDFEERVVAAMAVSPWLRMWHQIQTLFMRRIYIFARSRTLKVFFLVVPAIFITIAFAVAARQSQLGPARASRGPPQAQTFDDVPTDFANLNLLYIDLVDSDASRALEAAMVSVYPSLVGIVGSTLTMTRLTGVMEYQLGSFVRSSKVAYNNLAVAGLSGFQVQAGLNVTILVNPSTCAANTAVLASLLQASMGSTVVAPLMLLDLPSVPSNTTVPVTPPVLYDTLVLQMYVIIAIVLVVSYAVVSVADELNRRVYYNLRVAGMMPSAYWVSNLLHDLLWCILPFIVLVIGIYAHPMEQLKGFDAICTLALGFFLFAAHLSLQAYCLAVWRDAMKPVTYVLIMEVVTLVGTAGPYIIKLILSSMNSVSADALADVWPYLRATTPASCFFNTFSNIAGTGRSTPVAFSDMWTLQNTDTSVGLMFLFSALELCIPAIVLVCFSKDIKLFPPQVVARAATPPEDEDVAKERLRVEGAGAIDVLRALSVVHRYPTGKVAVNGVSFGIKRAECFGLLGPNGAGKSTLVKQLMGELKTSSGVIEYADGSSVLEYRTARLGVCQQSDALWDYLTAREHMRVYLRLRLTTKYREGEEQSHTTEALDKVHLGDDAEKTVGGFSGGMKRKLSVALAMFTGAQTVFLDEPSTGMDPFARRALWKVIHEALTKNHAIVLTTHSMEEADSVCGRIAIITEGSLKCIGNSQHLKNRFGGGYVLAVTMAEGFKGSLEDVDVVVRGAFPGAALVEGLGMQRKYNLGEVKSLAHVFGTMERQKEAWKVHAYVIGQTSSLEQIFLRFVGVTALE